MKIFLLSAFLIAFNFSFAQKEFHQGSMSDMGKDNFYPHIKIDTISNRKHLFGMGPLGKMQGEITIFDGIPYQASVLNDGTGKVTKGWEIEAPFFVYSQVKQWKEIKIVATFNSQNDIQNTIEQHARHYGIDLNQAFPFRINGTFEKITTHIVMPRDENIKGYVVGKKQANYDLENQTGELLGFYSQKHQGIFTHKDSFVHVHFLSKDAQVMGHLDKITQKETSFSIYLPEK